MPPVGFEPTISGGERPKTAWPLEPAITFLCNVKYTISNTIVVVTYHISYNIHILTFIPLYSRIKMKLVGDNYIGY